MTTLEDAGDEEGRTLRGGGGGCGHPKRSAREPLPSSRARSDQSAGLGLVGTEQKVAKSARYAAAGRFGRYV